MYEKGCQELGNILSVMRKWLKEDPDNNEHPLQKEMNGALFDSVAFDVIAPLPTTMNGNRFILTVIVYFSKWA